MWHEPVFLETDVDGGHDWDILSINEGLWLRLFTGWLRRSSDITFVVCPLEIDMDLLEGDIRLDEVPSVASDESKTSLFSHWFCLVLFFHFDDISNY